MRLFITTIILTMLAQASVAADNQSCEEIRSIINRLVSASDKKTDEAITHFWSGREDEAEKVQKSSHEALARAADWATIYSAICKD